MKSISVTTEISAPIEAVWAELSGVDAYAAWNPFITSFAGELSVGSRVEVRIAPPGGRPMTFRPTITELTPEHRIEWVGRFLVRGLVDGRHSFTLDGLEDGRTRLTQAEEFSGVLVPVMASMLARTREGFAAMNEAVRLRAEAATTVPTAR